MSATDYLRALSVGIAVFLGTLLLSIPLVAVYAYLIDPGHPPEFYRAAATWIAPWSSHIGGPLLFFWLNRRSAIRHPQRGAIPFACATIACYVAVDLSSVPLFGLTLSAVVTPTFLASLTVKAAAALAGAMLGSRRAAATPMGAAARS